MKMPLPVNVTEPARDSNEIHYSTFSIETQWYSYTNANNFRKLLVDAINRWPKIDHISQKGLGQVVKRATHFLTWR